MTYDDYSHVTQEMFDDALVSILDGMTGSQLLAVPGVYEAVSEELNNDVLATFDAPPDKPNKSDIEELSGLMDFDHVIEVHDDGTVTDAAPGIYAPELHGEEFTGFTDWRLLAGYTGQHGYNGPVMHPSELIGGQLARDILTTPGLYVALVVWADDPNDEPDGWAVAYRDTSK